MRTNLEKLEALYVPCSCGGNHSEGSNYYVTAVDAGRVSYVAGPYTTHEEALAMVKPAWALAEKVTGGRAYFYSFGTVAMPSDYTKPGVLMDRLTVKEAA